MASALVSAAQAARTVATAIIKPAQIQPGEALPASTDLKESAADQSVQLDLSGKNIIACLLHSSYLLGADEAVFTLDWRSRGFYRNLQ